MNALKPSRYMDLDTCVLRCAGAIIGYLAQSRIRRRTVASIESWVVCEIGEAARTHILPSLGLLYVLGVACYDESRDEIILLRKGKV